jgi:Zn-dependent protease with chaperone function
MYFPGAIIVSNSIANLPREQLAFVLAHEHGHHVQAHWRAILSRGLAFAKEHGGENVDIHALTGFLQTVQTSSISHTHEYEADGHAASLLKSVGLFDTASIEALLKHVGAVESDSHPGRRARMNAIAQIAKH